VIGFLRFVGLINAAAWFGAALFLVLGVDPATASSEMLDLLGAKNFPYFSIAINQVITARYLHWYIFFSFVALLHMGADWLYLGKYPSRARLGLVAALVLAGLVQNYWLQPNLRSWQRLRYAQTPRSQAAERNFVYGERASKALNLLVLAGLAVYVWRVGCPSDPTRFVSAAKFRS
jgi:hypothetical protein